MKSEKSLKTLYISLLAASGLIGYLSVVLGRNNDSVFYYGLIPIPFLLIIVYFLRKKAIRLGLLEEAKNNWACSIDKKRNFNIIKRYFEINKDNEQGFAVDDQTWDDLNMDEVYSILDRNVTTAGEQLLYHILRTPFTSKRELELRNDMIKLFQENSDIREEIQAALTYTGRLKDSDILDILFNEADYNPNMRLICNIAAFTPIVSVLLLPILGGAAIFLIIMAFGLNIYLHGNHEKSNNTNINSLRYLASLVYTSGAISRLEGEGLRGYLEKLKTIYGKCSKIAKGTGNIGIPEGIDVLGDYFRIMFLSEERSYYKVIGDINKYRSELKEMYKIIGELDSLISIASYREEIEEYIEPNFVENKKVLNIKGMRHPLLSEAVPNDVTINNAGIILTGSNMSGKSTFLRAVGVTALLAQTICTITADKYEASFFNILTSISPGDNIMGGKSYYLGEAEAVLRIINSCDDDVPALCIVDEIFRGTNPIERVSASVEILKYISKYNAISIVATHDLELTELLKDLYEDYYFTEEVDDEEGLKFDYKIRKGVSPTRNAIRLLDYLGYPEEIVKAAEERSAM